MKALRYYGPGRAEIEEIPGPTAGPGEVMVEVRACGLCATDVKTLARGHPKIKPGTVLGHEIAGVVVESHGVADVRPGDRVLVAPYVACGDCPQCARGHHSLCDRLFDVGPDPGGFSERLRVPARLVRGGLLHLPESLSFVEATLAEPLACSIHGLEMLAIRPGDSLLIVGDGPMGLLQAALGRAFGAGRILLSGMTPERLRFAARVADVVIDASREDVATAVRAATGDGADRVMVSVGEPAVARSAFDLVRKGGAINIFAGMPRDTRLDVDIHRLHYDEITLLGSFGFGPSHLERARDLLASGRLPVREMVTGTVPLAGVRQALEEAAHHRGIRTVAVFPEGGLIE
jgi:L-iditol 2-dehydrogenase